MATRGQRVVFLPGEAFEGEGVGREVQPSTPSSVQSLCTPQNVATTTWRTAVCPKPPEKTRRAPTSRSPTTSSSGLRTPVTLWPTPHGSPMGFSVMTPRCVFFGDTPTGPLTRKMSGDGFALSPRALDTPTGPLTRKMSQDVSSVSPRTVDVPFGPLTRRISGENSEATPLLTRRMSGESSERSPRLLEKPTRVLSRTMSRESSEPSPRPLEKPTRVLTRKMSGESSDPSPRPLEKHSRVLARKMSGDSAEPSPRCFEKPARLLTRRMSGDRSAFGFLDRPTGEALEDVLEVPETPSPTRVRSNLVSPESDMTPDDKAPIARDRLFDSSVDKGENC